VQDGVATDVVVVESETAKEESTSAKIKAALSSVWEVIAKYSQIGLKKFIDWLDEAGNKDELSENLLMLDVEGDGEPTPRRVEEAEKKRERAKLKAENKAKYKSMLHMKPPTSSMFLLLYYYTVT